MSDSNSNSKSQTSRVSQLHHILEYPYNLSEIHAIIFSWIPLRKNLYNINNTHIVKVNGQHIPPNIGSITSSGLSNSLRCFFLLYANCNVIIITAVKIAMIK